METVFTFKKKKLIVVRLKSDEETEQSHKHTLKYVLYRKSCLPAKKKKNFCQIKQIPLKKKSKKLALQLVTLLSSI